MNNVFLNWGVAIESCRRELAQTLPREPVESAEIALGGKTLAQPLGCITTPIKQYKWLLTWYPRNMTTLNAGQPCEGRYDAPRFKDKRFLKFASYEAACRYGCYMYLPADAFWVERLAD